jgi:hypothetical protein
MKTSLLPVISRTARAVVPPVTDTQLSGGVNPSHTRRRRPPPNNKPLSLVALAVLSCGALLVLCGVLAALVVVLGTYTFPHQSKHDLLLRPNMYIGDKRFITSITPSNAHALDAEVHPSSIPHTHTHTPCAGYYTCNPNINRAIGSGFRCCVQHRFELSNDMRVAWHPSSLHNLPAITW